jgi:hypothetical protein
MTMKTLVAAAAIAAALLLSGCSQKEPATRAVAAAEEALASVADDAQKYIPNRYAEVKAELDAARAALGEEKYAEALAAVQEIPDKARTLAEEATAAREKLAAELTGEWTRLSSAIPGEIDTLGARFAELDKLRRLPAELDPEVVKAARSMYETAQSTWTQAGEAFEQGNLEVAAARALEVERLAQEIRAALGLEQKNLEPAAEASPQG